MTDHELCDACGFDGSAFDDAALLAAATYAILDPDMVATDLDRHARRLADVADDAGPAGWTRGITLGETSADVRRLLEHALHDSTHHLDDVERGLATLRRAKS